MANTYTQIYIHVVFAVEGRQSLIVPEYNIEIYKYMTSVIQNQKNKIMAINGMPDHKFDVEYDPAYLFTYIDDGSIDR